MITAMDRLTAIAKGKILDHAPVFCNLFEQGAQHVGAKSIRDYYADGQMVAQAQIEMCVKYGYDNVWNLFYVGKEAELLGCNKMVFADNGPPNVGEYIINDFEDIHKLQIPESIAEHPAFIECDKCMDILMREVKGKYPILSYVTSSMSLPILLMGMDRWFDLLFSSETELRDKLLEKCCAFFRKHIQYHIDSGADCLVYSNPFASTHTVPMKMIEDLVFPWMERDLQGFDVSKVVFYCGGAPFNNVINPVIEKFGLKTFYLSPMASIKEGREIINGRGITCGVIDDIKLLRWSNKEIRQEVKRIVSEGMPGNRFAFGVMAMPLDIPEEKIHTLIDAACEFASV